MSVLIPSEQVTGFKEKRLLLSLHDVSPRDFDRVIAIDRLYEEIGVGPNYAMLVVPNFWDEWRLEDHPGFLHWLRKRAQSGVEIILHGFYHRDTTPAAARKLKTRLAHAICGEGEFASIDELEAQKRLVDGRALLEDIVEQKVDSFIAPAWQYSEGAKRALANLGFSVAENRLSIWSPASGAVLSRSPVIAYASRSPVRRLSSLMWSRISTRVLSSYGIVRHAIHPADINSDSLVVEIRRSLSNLLTNRQLISYRQLLDTPES